MKNKFLMMALLPFLLVAVHAQTYTVYSVIGNAKLIDGKKSTLLSARTVVSANTILSIGAESAVTLLDEKNSKMISFSTEGTFSVSQLIDKKNNKSKSVTRQYMSYLIKQLFSNESQKMSHPDSYMQVTASSYRSVMNDSMLLNRILQNIPMEYGITAEQQFCSSKTELNSDLNVYFELVSCETGFIIDRQVKCNTGSYVRVHNESEEALYVNVLNIDEDGKKYLVLPVDEAATCAHLLVPPMSTVSFKSEPFIFSSSPIAETFILVASQEPVDFSILMNPFNHSNGKTMKIGLYRNVYYVR